jgi:very-short-patch-repair endonuclease
MSKVYDMWLGYDEACEPISELGEYVVVYDDNGGGWCDLDNVAEMIDHDDVIVHCHDRRMISELYRRAVITRMPWGPFGRKAPYVEPSPAQSPIEEQFWAAYLCLKPRELRGLVQQYRVGRYRIDFAVPAQKFGIELDGLRSHASTSDMARDRRRERALRSVGWDIVRFGGQEVYYDPDGCVREAARQIKNRRRR